jgi:hypothetical protein
MKACTYNTIRHLAVAMAIAVGVAVAAAVRAVTIRKHHINTGSSITGSQREIIGCRMMHAYAIYESMQMQPNVTTNAHRGREMHKSLIDLAVSIAQ